jgi:hypothetical protein
MNVALNILLGILKFGFKFFTIVIKLMFAFMMNVK